MADDFCKEFTLQQEKYMPWRDYEGNAFLEHGGFWMQKQHIFLYPFYYIDYALAQICTFFFYAEMKKDRESAWARYLKLCKAGGTLGYFDLLHYVGIPVPFEMCIRDRQMAHRRQMLWHRRWRGRDLASLSGGCR